MFKKISNIDYLIVIIPIVLSALSVALIYSLVFSTSDSTLAWKQALFAFLGIIAMFAVSFVNYKSIRSIWWLVYIISIILLVIVEIFGFAAGGAIRWINLGFFQLQPSEIAKIAVVISLSAVMSKRVGRLTIKEYIWSVMIVLIPIVLILIEPDLGTALVIVFVSFMQVLFAKPKIRQLLVIVSIITVFLAVFFLSYYKVSVFGRLMHDYQRNRIEIFLNPGSDPYGDGYNVRQAQITIGSGGIWGKGLGRGSQSQLKFLPKPHTDFIFAGSAEAIGFVGASTILILYLVLIVRIYYQSSKCNDSFAMLLGVGIGSILLFQSAVNISMNLGLMPVTGIPLPFLSSGGTSLLVMFSSLGITLNIISSRTRA